MSREKEAVKRVNNRMRVWLHSMRKFYECGQMCCEKIVHLIFPFAYYIQI